MAEKELGRKRTCQECGSKYYDLNTKPPRCPGCGAKVSEVKSKSFNA